VRRLVVRRLLGAGVVMIAASGCMDTQAGTPSGAPGTTAISDATTHPGISSTSRPDNTYGAPRVTSALDGTAFFTKPCDVLTAAQLQTLNLPPGKPDTDSAVARSSGPGCGWTNSDTRSTVGVGFLSGNKNGLSDTYRGRDRFTGYFEPTEVDGYPAVFNDTSDFRPQGTCIMTVGISNTLTFIASERGRLGQKSCDRAKQVASMVIQTIKSGG
jgi:hypothetical protein